MSAQILTIDGVEVHTVDPKPTITERVVLILKEIPTKAPDLFQRIERDIFPLLVNSEPSIKTDVFRTIKNRFDLLVKDLRALEEQFARYENLQRLQTLSQKQQAMMTDEWVEKGKERLTSPDFFDCLVRDFKDLGLVGEGENAILLYLIFQSTRMPRPLHAVVQGLSGGGKTSVVKLVLSLLPEDSKLVVASASARAFEYLDERMTRDRVVFIEEFEGLEATVATLRVILSESNATRAVVQQNPQTKTFETVIHTTHHKFVLITTTTRNFIEHETANRLFCLHIDQKRPHLEQVAKNIRQRYRLKDKELQRQRLEVRRLHHVMHKLLQPYDVDIPYAHLISFPHSQTRHNRDLEKFLRLIEVIAFVRQYQKEVIERDGKQYVQAAIDDYRLAHRLLPFCLAEAFEQLPEAEAEVLRIAIRYVNEVVSGDSLGGRSTNAITTRLIRDEALKGDTDVGDQTKIGQILKALEFRGFVTSPDPPQQGSRRKYFVADDVDINENGEFIGLPAVMLNLVSSPEDLQLRIEHEARRFKEES